MILGVETYQAALPDGGMQPIDGVTVGRCGQCGHGVVTEDGSRVIAEQLSPTAVPHSGNPYQSPTSPPSTQPIAGKNSYTQLRKEIIVFLLGLGTMLAIAGTLTFIYLGSDRSTLWGLERRIAIGTPLLLIAAMHIAAGLGLLITSRRSFGIIGAAAGSVLTLFYFFLMISATGAPPINLMSVVVLLIPIILWQRVIIFLRVEEE